MANTNRIRNKRNGFKKPNNHAAIYINPSYDSNQKSSLSSYFSSFFKSKTSSSTPLSFSLRSSTPDPLSNSAAESEVLQNDFHNCIDEIKRKAHNHISDSERNYADALEAHAGRAAGKLGQNKTLLCRAAEEEVNDLKNQLALSKRSEAVANSEIMKLHKMLEDETSQREILERGTAMLQLSSQADKARRLDKGTSEGIHVVDEVDSHLSQVQLIQMNTITKFVEEVGLRKILSLLEAENPAVRKHAVKVVASLAAQEANQEKLVEAGGLISLLNLLRSSDDEAIHISAAAGAIANLAMHVTHRELIMAQGGVSLLSMSATNAKDPQTLRLVAGAIANLCGIADKDKDKQQQLSREGGIKALLGMVKCEHPDVLAQVARGLANIAKYESRASYLGSKTGKSLLLEDGALPWIVQNANYEISSTRWHIELTLCHLACNEANAKDMISEGALLKLIHISRDSSHEDIRTLAQRTVSSSPTFLAEARRLDKGISKGIHDVVNEVDPHLSQVQHPQINAIVKMNEEDGLQKIFSLLEAEDPTVRKNALKNVANFAAEVANQEKIIEAGGLTTLLNLLRSSDDETTQMYAAGAIANLAMNVTHGELIMAQGGVSLLSMTATSAKDPKTLRLVTGTIANLCGIDNDKLQMQLSHEGGIKALLGMVRCGHPDVLAQVARGFANFAKCEARASYLGSKTGKSWLLEDGALPWIVQNTNNEFSSMRRHIELALCFLAQHEANAEDMISGGALLKLVHISHESSREDIRTLAQRNVSSSPTFLAELKRLGISLMPTA